MEVDGRGGRDELKGDIRKDKFTEAQREAAKWEQDLRAGRHKPVSSLSWDDFRDHLEEEVLASSDKSERISNRTPAGMEEAITKSWSDFPLGDLVVRFAAV